MPNRLTQDAYRKLIHEDIRWLVDNTEDTLERRHICDVLWDSVTTLYGEHRDVRVRVPQPDGEEQ